MESVHRLLYLFVGFNLVLSDFRFCLNGPQRVLDNECPFGLVLAKPLDSPCILLARDKGTRSNTATLQSSICGIPEFASITNAGNADETTNKNEDDTQFQQLTFKLTPDGADAGATVKDTAGCMKECLKDWVDPGTDLPEEPEYDFGIPPPPGDTTKDQTQVSQDLFTYMNYDYETEGTLRDLNMFDVLREAMEVLEKHCRWPYVDKVFIDHIFAAFHYVAIKTGARTQINDLGKREHSLIVDALRRCKDAPMKFIINGTTCGDNSRIRTINNVAYRRDGKAWRWGKFDLMIEAAWMAIEFVHGYCFREYAQDLNFQHLLVKAMDSLFSNKVQIRWMYPTKLKDDAFIENMIGVRDANLTMRNIDFCVVASRTLSPYGARLGRPFEKQPGTYSSTQVGMGNGNSVNSKPPGWPDDNIDDYWKQYTTRGGVQAAIQGVGICAKTDAELTAYRAQLESQCTKEPDNGGDDYY